MAAAWSRSGIIKGVGIPAPSGPHTVGCVDVMHLFEGDTDGLLVKLFYPTSAGPDGPYPYSEWLSHKRYVRGMLDYVKAPAVGLLSTLVDAFLTPRIPALYLAPLLGHGPGPLVGDSVAQIGEALPAAVQPESFPIVVFSHGLSGMRAISSAVCCDLASHGYVVGAVEHRDHSACASLRRVPKPGTNGQQFTDEWLEFYWKKDNEEEFPLRHTQLCQRVKDVKQVVDLFNILNEGGTIKNMMPNDFDFRQFQGRLNMDMVAMMGHSFGGGTTLQSLSEDGRLKCGVGLDSWMVPIHRDLDSQGIQQPLLLINSHSFQWKENVERMMKYVTEPDSSGTRRRSIITIRGTNHYNQVDILFVMPRFVVSSEKFRSPLDPAVAHSLNMELIHTFLRRHLLLDVNFQHPVANLDGGEGCSEDLIMGTDIDLSAVGPDHSAGEGQPASVEGHGTEQPASVEGHGTEQPASVEGHGTEQPASVEGHGTEQPASVEGHGTEQPASVEGHGTEQPASVEGHGTEQPASVEGHGTEQPASVEGHGTEQPASMEGHGTEQPASVEGHGTEQPASVEGHGTEQPASVEGHGTEQPASVEGHGKMHDVQMKPVIEEEGTQNLHVEERASAEKPDEEGGVYIEADGNVQP
eukprot:Em0020g62a